MVKKYVCTVLIFNPIGSIVFKTKNNLYKKNGGCTVNDGDLYAINTTLWLVLNPGINPANLIGEFRDTLYITLVKTYEINKFFLNVFPVPN